MGLYALLMLVGSLACLWLASVSPKGSGASALLAGAGAVFMVGAILLGLTALGGR
jgi:hypothetical protein